MLALAALLLLQPQTLTHNYGVMRVDRLIQSIASETGWPLAAPRSLPADFVYANIKGLDQQQVMESLAKSLRGRWTERGQVQSFTLPRILDARKETDRSTVESFFKKGSQPGPELTAQTAKEQILKLREDSRKAGTAQPEIGQISLTDEVAGMSNNPFTTALRSLALLMGKEFWMGISSGDRVVATARPTRMQRALPPGWQPVMERLQREARLFSTAAAQYGPTESEEFVPFLGEYTNLPATLGPFDLVCEGSPMGPTARLVFTDKSGDRSVPDTNLPLLELPLIGWEAQQVNAGIVPGSEKRPFEDIKGSITLSPELADLADSFGSFYISGDLRASSPAPARPLPEALRQSLFEPEERDILDVLLREPLDQLAAKTGKGLVAKIPDSAAMLTLMGGPKSEPLKFSIFGPTLAMTMGSGTRLEGLGETQVLVPPAAASMPRYGRPAVARLLKGLAGTAPILDVLAAFCLEKDWDAGPIDAYQIFMPRLEVRQIPFSMEDADQTLLRIYGRLPAPLRQRLAQQPGTVLLGALPPESQNDVYRLVYGGGASFIPSAKEEGASNDPASSSAQAELGAYTTPFDDPFMMERSDWQEDPGLEPTRVLGDGLAPGLQLRVDLAVKPGWFELSNNGWPFAASPFSVYALAYELSGVDRVDGQQPDNPDAKAFVHGASARLSLGFTVPGTCEVRRIMIADDIPVNGARFGLSSLPEPLRKAIAAMVERVKADKANERPPDQTLPAAVP